MSKLEKSIKNARVAFAFYFVTLVVSFVSRKVFIDTLGTELVGLSSTMLNILGFLNLAELGIYTAVSYSLYKPLVDKDTNEISRVVSLFGFLYRWVGMFILICGIIVSFFLPLIFGKSGLSWPVLFGSYFTFLFLTLFSYFNNYRQILLTADQKGYVVTRITNYMTILKVVLQMIYLLYLHGSYYGWLIIELAFGLITRWWTNWKVMKEYPWLITDLKAGKKLLKEYPDVIRNIKNLFAHKIAEFILFQTDQILIYAFTTLTVVTYYTNYTMIIKRITTLISSTLGSNLAAVGHIIAENDPDKTRKVFTEYNALFFFIAGVFAFVLYFITDPFISLWLGREFVLPKLIFLLILAEAYITITRQAVMFYIAGYCLYKDVWAAWAEALLNIGISIVVGYYTGLLGVVLGTFVSSIIIVCLWKPYFLFREGFKTSVFHYWKEVAVYILLFIVSSLVVWPVTKLLPPPESYGWLMLNASVIFSTFVLVYGILMFFAGPGTKGIVTRLSVKFLHKKK